MGPYNILMVDDSTLVRMVISKTLQLSGHPIAKILEASNGSEALSILASEKIDLVFADINMPIMGGVELVAKMKDDAALKSIPIVMVSTEGSHTRIEQLKSDGILGYLRKPFTPEEIISVLKEILV